MHSSEKKHPCENALMRQQQQHHPRLANPTSPLPTKRRRSFAIQHFHVPHLVYFPPIPPV